MRCVLAGKRFFAVAAGSLVGLCLLASPAVANTVTVTTTTDNVAGSLRFAVEKEVEPGGTVIVPAGTYALSVEQLIVDKGVSIVGAGASSTVLTAHRKSRAVQIVAKGAPVTISGVTITEGLVEEQGGDAEGGGIVNLEASPLTLEHCAVTNNEANADGGSAQKGGEAKGGGILSTGSLKLLDVSVTGNRASARGGSGQRGGEAEGGGVWSMGEASLSSVTLAENSAMADGGAGPSNALQEGDTAEGGGAFITEGSGPTVSLSTLDVRGNTASAAGGPGGKGGSAEGGGLMLLLSGPKGTAAGVSVSALTASGNAALAPGGSGAEGGHSAGGGISAITNAASSIVNATVAGNTSGALPGGDGEGGGVWVSGEPGATTIADSTLDANTSQAPPKVGGGGNLQAVKPVKLRDTIVSGGTGPEGAQNCAGTIESLGNNLEDRDECGFHAAGDKVGANPQLGALQANGGPLPTQAPAQSSPAVDAGASCPGTDERGVARPQGAGCDIGAYELALPSVKTEPAATVAATFADLLVTASNPDLLPGSAFFQVGTTTAYGLQTSSLTLGAGASVGNPAGPLLTLAITGLKPGTVYHYRAVAANPDGILAGADRTFKTLSVGTAAPPVLSGLALRPSRLRAQRGRGASLARKRGASLVYKDSEAATSKFTVQRPKRGYRAGTTCRASRPHRVKGHLRRCTLYVTLGVFTHADKGGSVHLHFTGRVAGHGLAPGSYRLRAQARSSAGRTSNVLTISFSVVR